MIKFKNHLAHSLQGKGSCLQKDEEVATMLAGTDLVPISLESVRNLLEGAHYSIHETTRADEDTNLFMRRAFSKVLSDEHLTQSNQLCLIMHVPERRRHISEKELEELNSFIFELSRRSSGLTINWGIKASHLVQNMEIFIIASELEKQDATEATSTTARKSWHPLRKGLLFVFATAAISYSIHLMPEVSNIPSSLGCWCIGSFALLHCLFPNEYNFSNLLNHIKYGTKFNRHIKTV